MREAYWAQSSREIALPRYEMSQLFESLSMEKHLRVPDVLAKTTVDEDERGGERVCTQGRMRKKEFRSFSLFRKAEQHGRDQI